MNRGGWVCNLLLHLQQKVATAGSWSLNNSNRNKWLSINPDNESR